ncbi:MAG: AAA family ATPase [Pseudomonadota bacterium]|nr:AAA family ATPase [Pseudomonadota bacterium]
MEPSVDALRRVVETARAGLVERESLVEAIVLAAVAGEHVLVIGPPGTAKSEAVRRVARGLGGAYFEYLLGRFTEPNEIFGPIDLRRLREGAVETVTTGMLPEAELAFLDEVFLGSTAILNTLLGILNERTFRRGSTVLKCPLRVCVGASNALPEDESLAAFADRFLVRVFVEPVGDAFLEALLEGGWALERTAGAIDGVGMAPLDALATAARAVDLGPARPALAHAVRRLRQAGVTLPDRRIVRVQRLVAAAAVLDGRTTATSADLWPIVWAVQTPEGQSLAREVLGELLAATQNRTLTAAAAEASAGPLARAARVVEMGRTVLAARPDAADLEGVGAWRRRIEGIARDIDAGFPANAHPPALAELRRDVVAVLGPPAAGA